MKTYKYEDSEDIYINDEIIKNLIPMINKEKDIKALNKFVKKNKNKTIKYKKLKDFVFTLTSDEDTTKLAELSQHIDKTIKTQYENNMIKYMEEMTNSIIEVLSMPDEILRKALGENKNNNMDNIRDTLNKDYRLYITVVRNLMIRENDKNKIVFDNIKEESSPTDILVEIVKTLSK